MKQIWENVSQNCTVSWLEVLDIRENQAGTPEQAIRALNYRFHEKLHQTRTKAENYRDYHYPQATCLDAAAPSVPYHIMPPSYNMPMSTCQSEYRYIEDTNQIPGNYRYFQPMEHGFVNRCSAYGCLPRDNKYLSGVNPYFSTMPGYTRVPTGRLIELDVPVSVANYDKLHNRKAYHRIPDLDEVDLYRKHPSNGDHYDYARIDKKTSKSVGEKNNDDSWDFVYRNLESLGYSKDLCDREDVLQKRESDSRLNKQRSFKQIENDETYSSHRFDKRRSEKADANDSDLSLTNGRHHHHDTLPLKKKSSSFDLMDSNRCRDATAESHSSPYNKEKRYSSQTLPIQRSHRSSDQIAKIADTIKNMELSSTEKETVTEDEGSNWNCATCTYLNPSQREICEMCLKSKHKGNEDKPLASGGKECPQCTLVNERNVRVCDACGVSLKDSPTYI